MERSLVAGMLVAIVVWVGAVAYASSRLVWLNWPLFVGWCRQPRETRVRLALWLAIPLMKVAILLFCGHALWDIATGERVGHAALMRGLVVAPLVLTSAVLMLWWIYDRQYGRAGDRLWWALMFIGGALGLAAIGVATVYA